MRFIVNKDVNDEGLVGPQEVVDSCVRAEEDGGCYVAVGVTRDPSAPSYERE